MCTISQQEKKTIILITNDVDEAIILADRIIPLNPGPNAVLGPEFIVNLPRPRERAGLNHDPAFKNCVRILPPICCKKALRAWAGQKRISYCQKSRRLI